MDKISFLISLLIVFAALYNIDSFIIPTLDYFGKYFFFVLLNLSLVYFVIVSYTKSKGKLKILLPLIVSSIIFLISMGV